jgi:hypothetical protein
MAGAVRDVAAALLLATRDPPWLCREHLWATYEQPGRRQAIDTDGIAVRSTNCVPLTRFPGVFMVLLEHVREGDRLFYAIKTSQFWQAIDGEGAQMAAQYKGPSLTQSTTVCSFHFFASSTHVSGSLCRA